MNENENTAFQSYEMQQIVLRAKFMALYIRCILMPRLKKKISNEQANFLP